MDPQIIDWFSVQDAFNACTSIGLDHLHPVSLKILSAWSRGDLGGQEFLRLFTLPNSSYLDIGQCIIRFLALTKGA